jgi:hypothetical protein
MYKNVGIKQRSMNSSQGLNDLPDFSSTVINLLENNLK